MFLSIIIVSSAIVCKLSLYNETLAASPSFVRQEISDAPGDWRKIEVPQTFFSPQIHGTPLLTQDGYFTSVPYVRNESECKTPNGKFVVPDINAVTFISDGKTLNSTIWLSGKEHPINGKLDSFRDRLHLIVVNLTNSNVTTPDRFANIILHSLNKSMIALPEMHLHVKESKPTMIWGYYPAYKIVYQYNNLPFLHNNDSRIVMDVLTVKGNRGYIFSYIAQGYQNYSHYQPSIQQMIDSFGIDGFLAYKSSQLGIAIQYPFAWLRTHTRTTGLPSYNIQFYPRFRGENSSNDLPPVRFSIKVTNSPYKNASLDEITRGDISFLKRNNEGFNLINISRTTVTGNDNNPAYKEVYTHVTNNTNDKIMSVVTKYGSREYRMFYTSEAANYSNYLPAVEKMIHSFNIINTTQLKSSDTEVGTVNLTKYNNSTLGIGVIYPVNWTVEDGYYNRTADMFDLSKGVYFNPESSIGSNTVGSNIVGSNNVIRFLSPFADSRPISWYAQVYDMAINVEPVYSTGSSYHLGTMWTSYGKNWTRQLVETANTQQGTGLYGSVKSINVTKNVTDVFKADHVSFSLDLHELNYPSKYELFFSTNAVFVKDRHLCSLRDTSNWALVPPPQFNITTSPNSVELRPEENGKNIELQIKSDSIEPSNASLLLTIPTKDIVATWLGPNKTSIPRSGEATTHLSLKASDTAAQQQYTLPIEATMSFASRDTNSLTGQVISNTLPTNVKANSHLTVVVLPKLDKYLKFLNSLTVWISPLSSIWAFLAAVGVVLVPFILRMYKNKKSKSKKIDDY